LSPTNQATLERPITSIASSVEENAFQMPKTAMSERKIKWVPTLYIGAMHVGALAAFFTFSWSALILCIVLHWITGGLGITLCYHRLLTHRSFKVPKPVEYFLVVLASLAGQAGPISWVAAHRLHHARSDLPGDPHSPREGFFWAHMGWCLTHNPAIDEFEDYKKFAPDLAKDPGLVFLDRFHILWTILLTVALYAWGGLSFVLWGICARTVLVYHSTWFVNSATHKWGYQTYRSSGDDSTNLWWVALLTYGEGWHNNHHTFQSSARHGLKFWEFDTTYLMIQILGWLGLAKDIKLPSSHALAARRSF